MFTRFLFSALLGAGSLVISGGLSVPALAAGAIDPASFTATVDNPWYPLKPGTVLTYTGTKDEKPAARVITVTSKSKVVAGVTCAVVVDEVALAGKLADRTMSYYAQDKDGNVWSFGEDVQEINSKGKVAKTEGWHVGVDGAEPSLIMEAKPATGHTIIHKYTNNYAEVINLAKAVKVPYTAYQDALQVKEWTPDEPDVLVHKYYARGVGEVRDVSVKGDKEEFVLVSVKP